MDVFREDKPFCVEAGGASADSAETDDVHRRFAILGELTLSVVHELSQPLTALIAGSEANLRWLGTTPPDLDEVCALGRQMAADARRAAQIVASVRALVQRQFRAREASSLAGIIAKALCSMGGDFESASVRLRLDLGDSDFDVAGDPMQLELVMVNLARNAMEAMAVLPRSSRHLTVAIRKAYPGYAELSVEDSGPGIAAAVLPRLFDRFFTTKSSGMGLGLGLCRTVIESLGGEIRAENGCSGGARFVVVLPGTIRT